jgi:hypothetical protein
LKKYIPHILIALIVIAAVILFVTDKNNPKRQLDERITFLKKDKIPYGLFVAYNNLKYLFPGATVYDNENEPGYWDSLSTYDAGQALIIITPQFYPDEFEMKKLIAFVENGNDVFISTILVSSTAEEFMRCRTSLFSSAGYVGYGDRVQDTLQVSLYDPPFPGKNTYSYPGKRLDTWFYQTDTETTETLGGDELKRNNFIHLKAGSGNLYLHLAPMALSNYFLLHKNNIRYYEHILSLINPAVTKIGWDEYYRKKKYNSDYNDRDRGNDNLLSVLLKYPGLKAALLTAFFTLLLFILMEARRKQRVIPVIATPRNDSLDFVKTIGRLYYDRGDHKNLCKKMASYFLEHVRNRYKLPTGNLDEDFIKNLQFKTGCEESEVRGIVAFIKYLDDAPAINEEQLTEFHKQLESFYKKA